MSLAHEERWVLSGSQPKSGRLVAALFLRCGDLVCFREGACHVTRASIANTEAAVGWKGRSLAARVMAGAGEDVVAGADRLVRGAHRIERALARLISYAWDFHQRISPQQISIRRRVAHQANV